tara:strand:+ start:367 stop:495 length:129 start_codon:yes stop_codon:yes gene_type:complete
MFSISMEKVFASKMWVSMLNQQDKKYTVKWKDQLKKNGKGAR